MCGAALVGVDVRGVSPGCCPQRALTTAHHSAHARPPLCPPATQAIAEGIQGVRRLEQRHISVEEAKRSREVFMIGSSLPIMPVVQVRTHWLNVGDQVAGGCVHAVTACPRAAAARAAAFRGALWPAHSGLECGCCPAASAVAARTLRLTRVLMLNSPALPTLPAPRSSALQWDSTTIADGTVGVAALSIRAMLRVRRGCGCCRPRQPPAAAVHVHGGLVAAGQKQQRAAACTGWRARCAALPVHFGAETARPGALPPLSSLAGRHEAVGGQRPAPGSALRLPDGHDVKRAAQRAAAAMMLPTVRSAVSLRDGSFFNSPPLHVVPGAQPRPQPATAHPGFQGALACLRVWIVGNLWQSMLQGERCSEGARSQGPPAAPRRPACRHAWRCAARPLSQASSNCLVRRSETLRPSRDAARQVPVVSREC